jgi:hypothetical protein
MTVIEMKEDLCKLAKQAGTDFKTSSGVSGMGQQWKMLG